jgi:phosphatidate cytidylyltransferase
MVAAMVPFFIFSHTVAFPLLMAFLGAVGVYEMQGCIGAKKPLAASLPPMLVAAGLPFLVRYGKGNVFAYLFAIAFALIAYEMIVSVFSGKKFGVESAALSGAMGVYVAFGFAAVVMLRDLAYGQFIYFLTFIIPWVTDTFAYFSGRLFGKHKLIPEVSPKKTVEGSVGGTLFAVLLTVLYGFVIGKVSEATPNYLALAVVALAVSLLSQCGDLVMSLVKRRFGIKDYGTIFPGHGGFLDRCDSIIFTAPLVVVIGQFMPFLSLG